MKYFSLHKSEEDNKLIYRELVKKHHPDKGGSNETFLEVQKEWEEYLKGRTNGTESNKYRTGNGTSYSTFTGFTHSYSNMDEAVEKIRKAFAEQMDNPDASFSDIFEFYFREKNKQTSKKKTPAKKSVRKRSPKKKDAGVPFSELLKTAFEIFK